MKKLFALFICLVLLTSCGQIPIPQDNESAVPDYKAEETVQQTTSEKPQATSKNAVVPATSSPENKTVSITVLGLNGEIIFSATASYREGITVFELLMETTKEQNIPVIFSGTKSSPYVTSIGGLKEKEHGPSSGWVYTINNEMVMVSSGKMKLNPHDSVQWKYITKF